MIKTMNQIILTGAVKDGYGEAILRKLVENDYFVFGTYEKELTDKAKAIQKELKNVKLYKVDHSSRKSLASFVNRVKDKKISGLITAQMFFNMENLDDFDHKIWDKSLAVNLTAPNYLFHELKPNLTNPSSVVIVTSTEGFAGSFGASAYACTKAAIHNLVKTYANTSGKLGIRVNAVAAGWIGGVMDTDEVFNLSRNITPLGRLGRPEEIAETVYFLINSNSSFINGSVITADGGYSGVDTISKFEYEEELKNNS